MPLPTGGSSHPTREKRKRERKEGEEREEKKRVRYEKRETRGKEKGERGQQGGKNGGSEEYGKGGKGGGGGATRFLSAPATATASPQRRRPKAHLRTSVRTREAQVTNLGCQGQDALIIQRCIHRPFPALLFREGIRSSCLSFLRYKSLKRRKKTPTKYKTCQLTPDEKTPTT